MNKKEVLEIRKQFSPKNCAITKICGCYVDYEKNKKMESKDAFLALPEEEAFKYFDIFKKTLSGSIGKNMLNMEFPLDAEMPGGTHLGKFFSPVSFRFRLLCFILQSDSTKQCLNLL